MSLSADTQQAIQRTWGTADLLTWSHRGASGTTPASIDWDVIEQAVNAAIAWFGRRGYTFTEESEEVRYYCALWIMPRHRWSKAIRELYDELERQYQHVVATVSYGTGVEPGAVDDRRQLDLDTLDRLDRLPGDGRSAHPRGGF